MPFNRPSIGDLIRRNAADVSAKLPGTDPLLRRSVVGAVVRGTSGGHHELHGHLAWIAKALFEDSAEGAELIRRASIRDITPLAAVAAEGTITVTGSDGAAVPIDSVWRRGDGVEYSATAAAVLAAGTADVPVQAVVAGRAGNAAVGVRVSLTNPLPSVVSDAGVSVAIGGGAEEESNEHLRERVLDRIRNPPRGGGFSDYRIWTRDAHQDVTRIWVRPLAGGLGTVTVYFMTDDATDNGIPEAAVVTMVGASVRGRRPVTCDLTVAAPTPVALDVTIDMLEPDTAAVRATVEAELADLVRRDAEPGGTILLTHIQEAISSAAGEIDHELVTPADDVTHTAAQIAVPGAVTWQ